MAKQLKENGAPAPTGTAPPGDTAQKPRLYLTIDQAQAVAALSARYLSKFQVLALADFEFENEYFNPFNAKKGYETVANMTAVEPKKLKPLCTFMNEAKAMLAAMFSWVVEEATTGAENRHTGFMRRVIEVFRANGQLGRDNLSRDLDSIPVFSLKLRVLAQDMGKGAGEPYARLFVNFLKCIAWHSVVASLESHPKRITINRTFMKVCFHAVFGAFAPYGNGDMDEMNNRSIIYAAKFVEKTQKKATLKKALPAGGEMSLASAIVKS